jgi:hypothetical protein
MIISLQANGPVSAERKDLEFKGFQFGKTILSEWRRVVHETDVDYSGKRITVAPYCEEEGRLSLRAEKAPGIKRCSWYNPSVRKKTFVVGQASTNYNEWVFVDGVLASFFATMYQAQLPNLLPSLRAKYGAPNQVRTEKLQNVFGATVTNEIYEWQLGSIEITVSKYFSDLNTSEIAISNPALSKELRRRIERAPVDKSGL